MPHIFAETVAIFSQAQKDWEADMRKRGKKLPEYNGAEDGLAEEHKKANLKYTEEAAPVVGAVKPRKEGVLKATSKAEVAREIMRNTKDQGLPLDAVVQLIMDATGHDKALAKATYKANAARVGIAL